MPVYDCGSYLQGARNGANMLRACAAETRKHVRGREMATGLRKLADGSAHRLVGNAKESCRNLLGSELRAARYSVRVDSSSDFEDSGSGRRVIERLVLIWAEYSRKVGWKKPSQKEVGVRHA